MVGKACTSRLQKEYKALIREPRPNIEAHPSPNNILEWHYALTGPSDSPYAGGIYHGKIIFPSDYPFKAPSIVMCTPSGRFAPNAKICMSMTDFHPESWQPMWSVGTILTGLLSFMLEDAPTTGSVTSTEAEKRQLAAQSLGFNVNNLQFRRIFPHLTEAHQQQQSQSQVLLGHIPALVALHECTDFFPRQHSQDMLMHQQPPGRRPETLACFAQPGESTSPKPKQPAESNERQQRQRQHRPNLLWHRRLGIAAVAMLGIAVACLLAQR